MQLVLGVTVLFVVGVNGPLDWYHTISTGCNGPQWTIVVGVNGPLDWYHTISTGCNGLVCGWCKWTIRLVPYNQYWV